MNIVARGEVLMQMPSCASDQPRYAGTWCNRRAALFEMNLLGIGLGRI